jgi:formiminotetrahydrofolate cyclodeaminase
VALMELSVRELLDAFSAPTPTPGGGSAASFSGALATSLLMMVAALPKTRHGTREDVEALAGSARVLSQLRERFVILVDEDTAAYDAVVQAYRLPKSDDAERQRRQQAVQDALRRATDVPLEVMRTSDAAAAEGGVIARNGSAPAASDVGVGLELLRAASTGAALNVRANLRSIRDETYVAQVKEALQELEVGIERTLTSAREVLGSAG